jgi:hypothetical protein
MQIKTRVAGVLAASASAVALMAVPAFASTGPVTSGDGSVLGGNQVIAPITVPVDVCGNAVAVLGFAESLCRGGANVNGPIVGW